MHVLTIFSFDPQTKQNKVKQNINPPSISRMASRSPSEIPSPDLLLAPKLAVTFGQGVPTHHLHLGLQVPHLVKWRMPFFRTFFNSRTLESWKVGRKLEVYLVASFRLFLFPKLFPCPSWDCNPPGRILVTFGLSRVEWSEKSFHPHSTVGKLPTLFQGGVKMQTGSIENKGTRTR